MINMKKLEFEIINSLGNKIKCEVIATYHDKETNKDYMVYTDKTFTEDHKLKIYHTVYEQVDNKIKLIDSNDPKDKKIGLELVEYILQEINKNNTSK